jgi:protein disulfide-isomerase
MESKYLKYKNKYYQLKKQLNIQSGGSNRNEDFYFNHTKINNNNPTFYLFKASWCGHCKSFRENWNALSNKFKDKINFVLYDSDKNSKELKEWRVNQFPTLIFRKGNSATEYNGDRDINSIMNFINSQN